MDSTEMTHHSRIETELNAIRAMIAHRVNGVPYSPAIRERVARLVTEWGMSRREVAEALGMGFPTISGFVKELQGLKPVPTTTTVIKPAPGGAVSISAEREKHHREIAERLRERDERLRNRPAYCFNIDLLGDPPPGRSALDRRKSA
jgi:transposase